MTLSRVACFGFLLWAWGITPSAASGAITLTLNDSNAAPFTTPKGDGFLDLVATEAFRRANLQLKLLRLPAERGLLNANTGLDDGDLSRIAGLEKKYPNLVRVPEKLVDWHFVAFTRRNDLKNVTWENLQQYSVGHIKGWKIYETHLAHHTQVTSVENAEQLFTMLDKNRIDVALYARAMGLALIQKMGLKDIQLLEPSLAEKEMFIYLHRKHAEKAPIIAAALRDIKREGLYTKICHEKLAPFKAETTQCRTRH